VGIYSGGTSVFCSKCGQALAEGAYFCPKCGADNSAGAVAPASTASGAVVATPQTSGMAIASLICSLLPFFLVTPIVAVILGHLSLSQIKRSAGRLKGSGLAIAGLVIGYCSFVPILLIIAAIIIPNVLRARIVANESSAMASVRTVNAAEIAYSSTHSDKGFTCSLNDLKADGLDPQLANGTKYGYVFELIGCKAEAAGGPNTEYQLIAYPVKINGSGRKAYCSDQTNAVRYDSAGSGQNCLDNGTSID
jgi:type IV pilus assembly protein PilA